MRIGFAKPDYGIQGGFELVLQRIARELVADGHSVDWLSVDVRALARCPFGIDIPDGVWEQGREFFVYLGLVEAFRLVDAKDFDILVSTQPPSFVVEHARHLSLFSHHLRIFYDLSDVYMAAGFTDPLIHAHAQDAVRRVDDLGLSEVRYFLAASEVVQERLLHFNGLSQNVGVYHAGIGLPDEVLAVPLGDRYTGPLCVSRHEFPKRTELFVHALKFLPASTGTVVGTGGRLPWVRTVDAMLSASGTDLEAFDDRDLWLCKPGRATVPIAESNVRFVGEVTARELADFYRSALCVVAPAYLEDYGLTAIEAMAFGKPLIVCKDGGGLTQFVEDGVNGFIVEPTGAAIARAIQRFVDDPGLARELGRNAREISAEYTWARALQEVRAGLAVVAG